MTASVSSGLAPYTYKWSNNAATDAITVSPTATATYNVTVKNAFGCATSVSKTIVVKDIRDGDKNKVFICHNENSISVSVNAVPAHLAHGDLLGNCESSTITSGSLPNLETGINMSTLYPNPANNKSFIKMNLQTDEQLRIAIYDISGRVAAKPIYKNLKAGLQSIELNTSDLGNGVYLIQINGITTRSTMKLLLLH